MGYPYDRRSLDAFDIRVAFMHPVSRELGVPSTKLFGRHLAALAEFHLHNTDSIPLEELRRSLQLTPAELQSAVGLLTNKPTPLCEIDALGNLHTRYACRDSWRYTVSLFENICERLFVGKDPSALVYEAPDPDNPNLCRQGGCRPKMCTF